MKLKNLLNEANDDAIKFLKSKFKTYDDFMKFVKTLSHSTFETVQPKTTKELIQLIKDTIKKEGNKAGLNFIDTSLITDMTNLFVGMFNFNGKIDKWDVSNVTNMKGMFSGAKTFNQPLNNWDVSNVRNMEDMFTGAESFNQPIGNWDTSSVINMRTMFRNASAFNQDISNWDVSRVRDFDETFEGSKLEKSGNLPDWYRK